MRVAVDVTLPVQPGPVWNRLLDWERQPEWMIDAARVRVLSDRREGVGVRIAARTRVLGIALLTDELEVTTWDPPRRLVMVRGGFVRGRGEWRLDASPDGTRLRWTEELVVPIPLLGEGALLLYRPILRRLMARSLRNLARALRSD